MSEALTGAPGESDGSSVTASPAWTYNPWRHRPAAAVAAVVLGAGLCVVVLRLRQPWLWSAVMSIAALSAMAPAMTPVDCRVDDAGVARRGALGWEQRRWGDIRRAAVRPAGLLVSPFRRPSGLDSFRGLFLPWTPELAELHGPDVRALLARHGL